MINEKILKENKIIMAKKIHNLPQTRGEFQLRGNVTGTLKQNFYQGTQHFL